MNQHENLKFEWVAKLTWTKLQVGFNGCVHIVKCKMYFEVEYTNNLLAPKRDFPQKHVNHRKVEIVLREVKNGEWYMSMDCKHVLKMKLLMHGG
jgi:hypothetical protein